MGWRCSTCAATGTWTICPHTTWLRRRRPTCAFDLTPATLLAVLHSPCNLDNLSEHDLAAPPPPYVSFQSHSVSVPAVLGVSAHMFWGPGQPERARLAAPPPPNESPHQAVLPTSADLLLLA